MDRLSFLMFMLLVSARLFVCEETCYEWTEWMDDEASGIVEPSDIGEFELVDQLRGQYDICEDPTDIECGLAAEPHTPYDQTGQANLTCDLENGFMCFNQYQPEGSDCLDYAIRVQCPVPCPTEVLTTDSQCDEPPESDSPYKCDDDESQGIDVKITFGVSTSWRDEIEDKTSCHYRSIVGDIVKAVVAIFSSPEADGAFQCYTDNTLSMSNTSDDVVINEMELTLDIRDLLNPAETIKGIFEEVAGRINQNETFPLKIDQDQEVGVQLLEEIFSGISTRQAGSIVLSFGLALAVIFLVIQIL
ncbi:uncharacterized protein [Ptychodera flava]|uniref:uncharacterized protein n=1 Tax=Ptychodera flava TaxID=63121 RepID=UPI00396A7BDD